MGSRLIAERGSHTHQTSLSQTKHTSILGDKDLAGSGGGVTIWNLIATRIYAVNPACHLGKPISKLP